MTRRIRIRRTLRMERREMRCDFDKDVCYFRYLLNRAINRKKSIMLDGESLIVKY
jgi:hypothetical protein